ncbi:large conductance mechanosensitive channel protein MscL [Mycoplasmopsis primatum]|uniref:large conductance mechanosensitive channel protein MscL n=1 Tax=Mycoplasmopsis primatum TaxID=55604 RepID=UPI000496F415|nr:MscL family protein [Mycoplasmopsis primatum]
MFKKAMKDAWDSVKRGNMLMLAIGLLLGASFNAVVSSLANDIIMSAIASILKVDAVKDIKAGPVLIGKFLAALISFVIVSFIIFIMLTIIFWIKAAIKAKRDKKQPPVVEETKPSTEELILTEFKKINENFEHLKNQNK